MNAGAPYGISCEGTLVQLHSYSEDGTVGVIVTAQNKLPAAIQYEKMLSNKHGKDADAMHKQDILVRIDPKHMTRVGVN